MGAYWPIRQEPDLLQSLLQWAAQLPGRQLALPGVEADHSMEYFLWIPGEPLGEDRFHTRVPESRRPVRPDLVLAPCVGVTPEGFRLGYGGGFFDRFLARPGRHPVTVAVTFEACLLKTGFVPEDCDMALDWIATERGVRRAGAPARAPQ